jgi:O-antigen/teichoic acid export membrane protein
MSDTEAQGDAGPVSMRDRVVTGAGWAGLSQIAGHITRTIVAIVVARLLSPSDYGLAAMALVLTSLILIFSDLALGAALVQRKTLTEDDRSTAFWVTLGSGVLFTGLGVALAGPLSHLYGEPDTRVLFMGLSASFMISALGATQQSLMLRDMQYRRLELISVAGVLAGAPAAVALAAAGTGAWAIIGQQLVGTVLTSVLLWRASNWRPELRFSRASLRDLWSFSGFLVGHRLLYYTQQNADNFIIGRFVGAGALGAYAIAYNVMLAPASKIGGPLQRVLAPAFSRMQDEPERIADAWARVTRMIAALAVPALAGLMVIAPDFVDVLLGHKWHQAAPILQVLAWVGILQALQSVSVDILMARDRTSLMFRFSCCLVTAHLAAFIVGVHWGVMGVAVGYAISSTFVDPALLVITSRVVGISPFVVLRAISGVFQAAAGMVVVLLFARPALVDGGVPVGARLALLVLIGAAVYLPLCAWRAPEVVREVGGLVPGRRREPDLVPAAGIAKA